MGGLYEQSRSFGLYACRLPQRLGIVGIVKRDATGDNGRVFEGSRRALTPGDAVKRRDLQAPR